MNEGGFKLNQYYYGLESFYHFSIDRNLHNAFVIYGAECVMGIDKRSLSQGTYCQGKNVL
jgi:hypothetical protein